MKEIYSFNVMEALAKGAEVYALMFTEKKVIVENAERVQSRILARYLQDKTIKWYASEIEEENDGETY